MVAKKTTNMASWKILAAETKTQRDSYRLTRPERGEIQHRDFHLRVFNENPGMTKLIAGCFQTNKFPLLNSVQKKPGNKLR